MSEGPTTNTTVEDLSIANQVSGLQNKLNLLNCYTSILKSGSFLPQTQIKKFKRLGVYDEAIKNIQTLCETKVQELSIGQDPVVSDGIDRIFTSQEIEILKSLAQKIIGRNEAAPQQINRKPLGPATPNQKPTVPRPDGPKAIKAKKQVLTKEDTKDKTFQSFIGTTTRTLEHRSLQLQGPVTNSPPPYSTVKILEINEEDKRALIQFEASELNGVKASIDVNELAGFEYLE